MPRSPSGMRASWLFAGQEVGGPADGGPLLGLGGASPGGPVRRFDRVGTQQQPQGRVVHPRDVDDDLRRSGRVPRLPAAAGLAVADHPADRLLIVLAHWQDPHRRTGPVGSEPARLDDGHLDPQRLHLGVEHLGEALDAELGGLVGSQPRSAADPPADGRELDEMAGALRVQERHGGLGDVDDAEEVGLDLRAEVVVGVVLDGCGVRVAGVVDHHVQSSERVDGGLDGRTRGRWVGDVQGDGADPVAVAPHELVELFGLPCGGDHPVPAVEHGLGQLPSEPTGTAGDQPGLGHEKSPLLVVLLRLRQQVFTRSGVREIAQPAGVTAMLVNRYLVLARRAPSLQTAPGRREPHRGARHARPADRPGTGTARLVQADAEPRQQRGAPRLHTAGAVLRPVLRGRGRPGRRTAPPRARLRSGHPWAGGLRGGVLRLVALRDVRWVPSAAEPMHGSLEEGRIRIVTSIGERIAGELGVRPGQVVAAIELLDGGATVPFIARYRKEMTGTLDDAQLRTLEDRLGYLRELEERRAAVIESIRGQDKLDPELEAQILAADSKARLEDLYLPFRPKRRTKAQVAREAGLEPLADRLLADPAGDPRELAAAFVDAGKGVADVPAALEGARAILVERFAEDADLIGGLRERMWSRGRLVSRVRDGKQEAGAKFADYFDFAEPFSKLPSHRILAMFRGESEEVLDLTFDPDPAPRAKAGALAPGAAATLTPSALGGYELEVAGRFGVADRGRPGDRWLLETVRSAWRTRILVHLALDLRARLWQAAEDEAVRVFAANLRDLLLAAPAGTRATMGLEDRKS